MQVILKKISFLFIIVFFVNSFFGILDIYAKDVTLIDNGNIDLSKKYSGKKLEKLKNTITTKSNYRFLINTSDTFEDVSNYFNSIDKKIKIKEYGNGNYMLKLPKNTNLLNVNDIDSGLFPITIGKYDVLQPELVEGFGYLDSEENSKLWGNNLIGADLFQEELQTKEKVKVAILDTGIDYNNTDLDNNYDIELSYNFINDSTYSIDDNGHGTQVAGIIGSEVNSEGRYGVNSNSELVSLKVLDKEGLGTSYDILEAVEYAKVNGIKVLNMSFGGNGNPETSSICEFISDAKSNGIFTIVSAGNNSTDISKTIPAGCSDSIVVGAIKEDNTKADFSNFGTGVIYAPGEGIYTTNLNDEYITVSGTSFSAAFVSGIISKELAYNSSLSYDEVISNLYNNYNLLTNIENNYDNNNKKIEILDGLFIYEDYLDYYDKFDDFKFIDIDDEYIYYYNKFRNNEIYKIKINNDYIFINEEEYKTFPDIIFSEKYNFEPYYFASGEFDSLENYDFSIPESNIIVNEEETLYNIYTNNGEIINNTKGYVYDYSDGYFYFRNLEDNRTIYRIKKDGTGLKKVVNIPYLYIHLIDENYLYYRNYDDDTKMYRVKKDGTEVSGGSLFVNIRNAIPLFHIGDYIYYQDTYNGKKINRIKKDGSQLYSIGEKIIDVSGSAHFNDGNYIYYRNRTDSYNLYKANIYGTDSYGGIKIFNFNTSVYYYFDESYNDEENIYFYGGDSSDSGIYRIAKNGSDVYKGFRKIKNGSTGLDMLLENGNYIYYRNYEDSYKIYRVNKNQSELSTGGNSLSSLTNNYLLFIDSDELYYKNNSNGYIYKIDLNDIDNSTYGIQINSMSSSEIMNVENDKYLYYTNGSYLYRVEKNQTIITSPTNLKQEILSPEMDTRDIVNLGEKIGKFQSGSGVILSAEVTNNTGNKVRLAFDIYRFGSSYPTQTYYSNSGAFATMTTGTLERTIPYLGAGEYYWKARVETDKGNTSEAKDFGTSNAWEYDYALYEGFEPYPYGYKFGNPGLAKGMLSGGTKIDSDTGKIIKIDGTRWEVFNSAFPEYEFDSELQMLTIFDNYGFNIDKPYIGGNCFGMALSSTMQYSDKNYMNAKFNEFFTKVGTGTIWNNIEPISTSFLTGKWNEYNDIVRTILSFQIYQYSGNYQEAEKESLDNLTATGILNQLNKYPSKSYILSFYGEKDGKNIGHAVVPYKVEGNKIYIWDNNYPYTQNNIRNAYEQYIEVDLNNGIWSPKSYIWDKFSDISIVEVKDIDNSHLGLPAGFNDTDTLITLSGSSDLVITDFLGRESGFINGKTIENIPGVKVIIPLNATLTGTVENNWKQIYLPQKQDLTIKVSADTDESYDLMVAGGDYYTKISGVETNSGQVDSFIPTRESLQIDFDDNKIGDYDLMINNFHNSGTGTIYMDNVQSKIEPQQYIVSWTGVIDNTTEAIIYEIDTDNDGTFDESINLPPVYQDNIAPITSYNISGELNANTSNTYIETATIDLNAIDNDGGTGVDKIYYAIGTDLGSLVYVEYTEPVIVNGVGDYTLNYYSKDLFGNIEEVKTVSFSLTERPETYAGNISGYVYDDSNENGIQDNGEKFMAGWKVCIDLNNNNDCEEQTEQFNVTNNDGYYEFDSLATGTYKILEIPHQNWIVTNNNGYYYIKLSNGELITDNNFGNYKIKANNK